MFGSLGARLIAAFASVILLSLLLVSGASAVLLAEYQTQREMGRLQELAVPISYQVRVLQFQGATAADISAFLERQAGELELRIALLDANGVVVHDTAAEDVGAQLLLPPEPPRRLRFYRGSFASRRGEVVFFAIAARPPVTLTGERVERSFERQDPGFVALLASSGSLQAAWLALWPRLAGAALLSLLISIGVALVLSASISRPLVSITRASEAMARGHYEQTIPVTGRDEVGRLASAFNEMARQVSRSHRSMRDLLANVSHELRTPLTSVQGFSQAMVDGTVKKRQAQREAAGIINQEATRMQRLVEDLLYLSKIESGQLLLEQRPVELTEVVEACARRVRHQAGQIQVQFEVEVAAAPTVQGDGSRLEQVLDNLLDNALRHTPPGGRVTVRLGREHADGGQALLSVHNTGSYIPAEDLARIFERFYQVGKGGAIPSRGTGLGLAIAHEIALAHGGTLSASSSPTEGTAFRLSLPGALGPTVAGNGRDRIGLTVRAVADGPEGR